MNINVSKFESDNRVRSGRKNFPPVENTRFTGADEAGRLKYFGANLESLSNVAAFFFQKVKGSIFSSA